MENNSHSIMLVQNLHKHASMHLQHIGIKHTPKSANSERRGVRLRFYLHQGTSIDTSLHFHRHDDVKGFLPAGCLREIQLSSSSKWICHYLGQSIIPAWLLSPPTTLNVFVLTVPLGSREVLLCTTEGARQHKETMCLVQDNTGSWYRSGGFNPVILSLTDTVYKKKENLRLFSGTCSSLSYRFRLHLHFFPF